MVTLNCGFFSTSWTPMFFCLLIKIKYTDTDIFWLLFPWSKITLTSSLWSAQNGKFNIYNSLATKKNLFADKAFYKWTSWFILLLFLIYLILIFSHLCIHTNIIVMEINVILFSIRSEIILNSSVWKGLSPYCEYLSPHLSGQSLLEVQSVTIFALQLSFLLLLSLIDICLT